MYRRILAIGTEIVPDSMRFVEPRNSAYAATADGRLIAIQLFDGAVAELGSGYADPVSIAALTDGLRVAVAQADGAVMVARLATADRDRASLLAQLPGPALGIDVHPDSTALLALSDSTPDGTLPQLLLCDLATGNLTLVTGDLEGARTLAVDRDSRTALVFSILPGGGRTLTTINLDDATTDVLSTEDYDHISYTPTGGTPVVFATRPDPATGADLLTAWDGAESVTESLPGTVDGLTHWGSLVLVASGTELHAVEWQLDDGPLDIDAPIGPLITFGYTRLHVDLPAQGLAPGDVAYAVREGVDAGSISLGVEPPDPEGTESVMLLAGHLRGEFHLEATSAADGSLLATRRFRVTTHWPDATSGPPVAVTGDVGATLMDWGGTGGVAGYRFLTPREWRVLVVLVSPADRGFDDPDAMRTEWKDRAIGGGESLRHYYEEVSAYVPDPGGHGMTVKLVDDKVFGPIEIDLGWGNLFEPRGNVNAGWRVSDQGVEDLAGAVSSFFADLPGGNKLIELADSIVFVVRSGSDRPQPVSPDNPDLIPTKYVWGSAIKAVDFWRKTPVSGTEPTTFTQFARSVMFLTDRVPDNAPHGTVTRTACHELGHNLGLADLYNTGDFTEEIDQRAVGAIDLMHESSVLPHFSLANRLALGWIDPAWLRRFDFTATPAGDSVRLQCIQTVQQGGPTDGRVAGIEIPITDDWSYLFEYRREQPGQFADRDLNPSVVQIDDKAVIGTDLRVRGGETARPPILRLPKDIDGDGAVLISGRDYRDNDTTNPERMHDFVLTADRLAPPFEDDTAEVTVEYLQANRPQLMVHPAPGNGNFRSKDIRLVSRLGSALPYVVKGATNHIEVDVHNVGSLDATNAEIKVKWLTFTLTGAAEWNELPDPAPFNVAKRGGVTTVKVPWELPASVPVGGGTIEAKHFCVRVDIVRYFDPEHAEKAEIVVHDNWAQSNFDTAPVGHGSPSDRLATAATATNTLPRRATYRFDVAQSTLWYRVYLGHKWLELAPGQTQPVPLAYESLAGDPVHGEEFDRHIEEITSRDHHVAVTSSVVPRGTECPTPRTIFGCGLTLRTGFRVIIDEVGHDKEGVFARVSTLRNGHLEPMRSGRLHCAIWPDDDPEQAAVTSGPIRNGRGTAPLLPQTVQDLRDGRPMSVVLGRPGDNVFVAAATTPASVRG